MEEHYEFGGEIVWRPTDDYVRNSRLKGFMDQHGIATFEELMRRSTDDVEWFWRAVLQDLDIQFYDPYRKILDTSRGVPWAQWCVGVPPRFFLSLNRCEKSSRRRCGYTCSGWRDSMRFRTSRELE